MQQTLKADDKSWIFLFQTYLKMKNKLEFQLNQTSMLWYLIKLQVNMRSFIYSANKTIQV